MIRIETDAVVVGAGPAGLSAAIQLARGGVKVDVVDAGMQPGGQYWMREIAGSREGMQSAEGRTQTNVALSAGVRIHSGAEVWAVFPNLTVAAAQGDVALEISARALIVASGAHDRTMPFPGWTLPGVMTPGAGQRMVKTSGVSPGNRIMLAGSGPFLLAVAATLQKAGAAPVAFIEAQKPNGRLLANLLRYPSRWGEISRLGRGLRAISTRRFGWIVTEAVGQDRVEAVRIAPLKPDGTIDIDRAELLPNIDFLLVGYGFRPSIEITALLRCAHRYDQAAGGWICVVDPSSGRTSQPMVYGAGEISGIGGFRPAVLSARLAALSALEDLGKPPLDIERQRAELLHALRPARRFAGFLNRHFPPPQALRGFAREETIVCRCEEVTRGELRAAHHDGGRKVRGAKLWTRAGMGRCQGRICGWAVAEFAAADAGSPVAEMGFNPPRIPLRPVALSTVCEATAPHGRSDHQ